MKKIIITAITLLAFLLVEGQTLTTQRITDWNNLKTSGFYESIAAANQPSTHDWYWGINLAHTYNLEYPGRYNYGGQILFAVNGSDWGRPEMYVRSTNQNGAGLWAKVLHDTGDQNINGNLHLSVNNGGGLRVGQIGDPGNLNVPVGGIANQYNIDFSGYRNIALDQIGARISAIRYNNYVPDYAYIQNTALAFYTNGSGLNAGVTDLAERMRISPAGNVGIGTTNPDQKLTVKGKIHAEEVIIDLNVPLADYVFKPEYKLMPLDELEQFVKTNSHLPEIPSASKVKEEGMSLGEMQNKLLQKVEELTLYVIQQEKKIQEQSNLNVTQPLSEYTCIHRLTCRRRLMSRPRGRCPSRSGFTLSGTIHPYEN